MIFVPRSNSDNQLKMFVSAVLFKA
ncbi:hypothetical protein BEH82_02080 [Enterococcus faecalis]|nr:hypothetical protein BEH80_13335 [Enterococcus faecalis]OIU96704.1 hypothetical protein BEH82_02080 [Enterococcus faecalis]